MKKIYIFLALLNIINFTMYGHNFLSLPKQTPFSYDLGVRCIGDTVQSDCVTICCHGYGHNHQIVDVVYSYNVLKGHLIGFNFPDHDITPATDHKKSCYGTIDEILPLLYIVKCASLKFNKINLYGFSAGGGAVVNMLAIINRREYKQQL